MAQDDHSGTDVVAADSSHEADVYTRSPGTAIIVQDAFDNPGFEPHRPRVTDEEPKREKRAQRTVYLLFYLSILGSVWAIAAYMLFPIESNDVGMVRLNNMFIGIGATLALLGIGFGAIHWGKSLMTSAESAFTDVIGKPPRQFSGATGPLIAASSGCASAYEIGSTGIFMIVAASSFARRFAPSTAPTPGVRGSPGYVGMSMTLPRCTPSFGRYGPCGKVSPSPKPSSFGSE